MRLSTPSPMSCPIVLLLFLPLTLSLMMMVQSAVLVAGSYSKTNKVRSEV